MKAIILTKFGPPDVLQIQEVENPTILDHQVLIKVHATSVNPMDYRLRGAKTPLWPISRLMIGIRKPKVKIPGNEVAGEIIEVGKDVTKYKKGDKVFGANPNTYAEYTIASERSNISIMPQTMSYEEGTSIAFGGITSLYFLEALAKIQKE